MLGRTIGGKYAIVRQLGAGGMGAVYEARHTGTGRRVAIKVITADLAKDPHLVARFEREALAAGAIDSEHIVQVFDVGTDAERGEPFLAMELLVGEDVQQLLARLGPIAADAALRIGVQACQGLSRAHDAGIVHRDIKPANLFLAVRESQGLIVKVLDFGIAKMTIDEIGPTQKRAALTQTGTLLGSPLYMSPEQSRSKGALDHRTDIWSLGIVLYQALSGRTPFDQAESLGDFILAVCTTAATPIRSVAPWVDPAVAQAVQRALAIEPGDRYQSAAEMRDALAAFLPGGASLRATMLVPAVAESEDRGPDTAPATPFVIPEGAPSTGPARIGGGSSKPFSPTALIADTLPAHPLMAAVTPVQEGTPPDRSRSLPQTPVQAQDVAPLDRSRALLQTAVHEGAPVASLASVPPTSQAVTTGANLEPPAPIAVVPSPPRRDRRRLTGPLATGVVLVATAGSLAAVYALGWLGPGKQTRAPPQETPSATVDPPPRTAPSASLNSLSGAWWSEAGVAYEGVVNGSIVELRVREPDQLPGLGFALNEKAFGLRPIAGEPGSFWVNAVIRPPPPKGTVYDHARAASTCVHHWSEVSGKHLKAAEVMDRLILQTVKLDPTPLMFVREGSRVVGCAGLENARAVEIELVLGRTPVTSPVPRWTPLDPGAHDGGAHGGKGYGAPCVTDAQCSSHHCVAKACR